MRWITAKEAADESDFEVSEEEVLQVAEECSIGRMFGSVRLFNLDDLADLEDVFEGEGEDEDEEEDPDDDPDADGEAPGDDEDAEDEPDDGEE